MNHATASRPPDVVRVVVEEAPDLEDRVRDAALRAEESECVLELVEPVVADRDDHAARARAIQWMDEALSVARRTAPGVPVRVGPPAGVPRPR